MIQAGNFEAHAAKLLAPDITPAERLALAVEIRDGIEIVHGGEYINFLKFFFPAFAELLTNTPAGGEDGPQHRLRNVLLEVLSRMPLNEALRPYAVQLLRLCANVLASDAEENALVATRITSELHKAYRPTLEAEAVPFLQHVATLYNQFADTCTYHFEGPGAVPPPASAADGGAGAPLGGDASAGAEDAPRPLIPALRSFRVITDAPLIVMFIFQLYPRLMQAHMADMLPAMVEVVALRGPAPETLPPHLRAAYADLRAAQVKTVSFVTFLLRVLADALRPHSRTLAAAVVHLLLSCPDVVATRKELLIATRHMLSTEFRFAFAAHTDTLLSETALLGTGRAAHEALRPLAFQVLAELVACAEGSHRPTAQPHGAPPPPPPALLSLPQLSRVVTLFSRGLHDASLPLAVHGVCVRVLLNLVEGLYGPSRRGSADPDVRAGSRALLGRILAVVTAKMAAVHRSVPGLIRTARDAATAAQTEQQAGREAATAAAAAAGAGPGAELLALLPPRTRPVAVPQAASAAALLRLGGPSAMAKPPPEPLKDAADAKVLVKTLLVGLKTLVWSITHFNDAPPGGPLPPGAPAALTVACLSAPQVRAVARLFATVPSCLRLFTEGGESSDAHEAFAAVFAVMEPRNLLDALQLRLDDLFAAMLVSGPLIQVPHVLLSSTSVSVHAADALATHLVGARMASLGAPASPAAGLVLKLWSLLLHAVTKFSDCEAVLLPHVPPLVEACLAALRAAPDPTAYVRLLRYLFRALSHAKFDALYKAFVPLLPPVLDALAALLAGPERPGLHDAAVELSLSLPARLSTLLPHLPRLMGPLVSALRGGAGVPAAPPSPELQLLGLRKLEGWVDSLNPEYLEPCLADCEPELMTALWALLRPPAGVPGAGGGAAAGPGPHALRALQLLGKLGGRGRRVLRDPARLEWRPSPEHGLRLILTFPPATSFLIPLDRCLQLARGALTPPLPGAAPTADAAAHRRAALAFVRAALVSLLNLSPVPAVTASSTAAAADATTVSPDAADAEAALAAALRATLLRGGAATVRVERASPSMDLGIKTKAACGAERATARQLLAALLCADADTALGTGGDGFTAALARHAAALCVTDAVAAPHLALPLAQLLGLQPGRAAGAATGDTPRALPPPPAPPAVPTPLRQLEPLVIVDGMLDALCEGTRPHARAAAAALCTFVDAALLLCAARAPADQQAKLAAAEEEGGAAGSLPAVPSSGALADADKASKDGGKAAAAAKAEKKAPPATKAKRSTKRGGTAAEQAEQDAKDAKDDAAAAAAAGPAPMEEDAANAAAAPASAPALAPLAHALPPFMDDVWGRVLHCCHGTSWGAQLGGVTAVAALMPRLPAAFLRVHAAATARALLSALRALPEHAVADAADCAAALTALVAAAAPTGMPSNDPAVAALASVAATEIASLAAGPAARRAASDTFAALAVATGAPVAELCAPHLTPLLAPLASRPLAGRPFRAATEAAAALTFALSQRPPLLSLTEPLLSIVGEALTLCEADDPTPQRMPPRAAAAHARLRTRCLALCSAALGASELQQEASPELLSRVVSVFFKVLTRPRAATPGGGSDEAVAVAREGVRSVVAQKKLPRDLVQASLRPLLAHLGSHKPLTLPLLASLRHLLELLSSWFTESLGANLLEYLNLWAQPDARPTLPPGAGPQAQAAAAAAAAAAAPKSASRFAEELRICAAVVELFHLLALPGPAALIEPLVTAVMKLEAVLPRGGVASELVSPYRAPLLLFLNRHAAEAAAWFTARLGDDALTWRLRDAARMADAAPLVDALCAAAPRLVAHAFHYPAPPQADAAAAAPEGTDVEMAPTPVAEPKPKTATRKRDGAAAAAATPAAAAAASGSAEAQGLWRTAPAAYINGAHQVAVLAKLRPEWLAAPGSAPLAEALLAAWQSPERRGRAASEEALSPRDAKESAHLAKALVAYARANRADMRPLFALLSAFWEKPTWDVGFVRDFYTQHICAGFSRAERAALLRTYVDAFAAADMRAPGVQANLAAGLQVMILPMLSALATGGADVAGEAAAAGSPAKPAAAVSPAKPPAAAPDSAVKAEGAAAATPPSPFLAGVVDETVIAAIVTSLLDPPEAVADALGEPLRVELLQLATLLIRGAPDLLIAHRKELIKFGWHHLKREEPMAKQWAFLNVATFLDAYQAPEKIILQVFVALLRTAAPESRPLVRAALDILLPALPRRLPQGDARHPIWIRYTKKILVEEGHSTPHLVHIWQLLVRHAGLFYASRAQFVPQMVNSLSRLALPSTASAENRGLALDLAWLILHWERMRRANAAAAAAAAAATEATAPPASETGDAAGGSAEAAAPAAPAVGVKRGRAATAADAGAKTPRTEAGRPASPADKATPPAADAEAGAVAKATPTPAPEDEYKPTPAMEDMLANFLIRTAFLLGDAKDKELVPLQRRALELVSDALALWPHAAVKLTYVEKLLSTPAPGAAAAAAAAAAHGQALEPAVSPALGTAVEVVTRVLAAQAGPFMANNGGAEVLAAVTEAAFLSRSPALHAALAAALSAALSSPAAEGIASLAQRLNDMAGRALAAASAPGAPTGGGPALSCALRVLGALADAVPATLDPHVPSLCKLLVRLAREPAAQQPQPQHPHAAMRGAPPPPAADAEYGSLAANTAATITLCARRVLAAPAADARALFLRVLSTLLADRTAAPSVHTAILAAVCAWVRHTASVPPGTIGTLTPRDATELLRRVAALARPEGSLLPQPGGSAGAAAANVSAEAWERPLLAALLAVCTGTDEAHAPLRAALWTQVEAPLLLGLRARDPATRAAFLALHDRAVARSLPARLRHIVAEQEWDAAADSFWLRHAIDLLCSALVVDEPLTVAPNAARLPALLSAPPAAVAAAAAAAAAATAAGAAEPGAASDMAVDAAADAEPAEAVAMDDAGAGSDPVAAFAASHAKWLAAMGAMRVRHLLGPLRELAWREPAFAHHLWVLLFPISWATLAKEEQLSLAKPLIALLSRDCHARQAGTRVNCVQALLEGISLSHPQPKMPSELVKFLGRGYCAWHVAVPLLESHVLLFPSEPRCFDALAELYRQLGEEDALFGLWRQRAGADATRAGLALAQHGFHADAAEVFHAAAARAVRGGYVASPVSKTEMCLWEAQWLSTCRALAQWDGLADWAAGVDHPAVAAEAAARRGDWALLRESLGRAPGEDALSVALLRAGGALHEGAPSDAEAASAAAVRAALERWARLPELPCPAHGALLGSFQALMETAEAGRVLAAIGGAPRGGGAAAAANAHVADVKDTLDTWRGRAPCEWEPLSLWGELLTARSHVYGAAARAPRGGGGEHIAALGARDRAWAATRHAAAARKHNAPELALQLLSRAPPVPPGDVFVPEAFARLREQTRSRLALPSSADAVAALTALEASDVTPFREPALRAELLRLRGVALARAGDGDAAHASFTAAAQLCRTAPDVWLSWGEFCESAAAAAANGAPTPGGRSAATWSQHAVVCYLSAVRHGGAAQRLRRYLCRVIAAASAGGPAGRAAAEALERHANGPPVWTWVQWAPQLLLSLDRPEARHVRPLLARVAVAAPQAVYYNLRSFVLEKRDVVGRALQAARAAQAASAAAAAPTPAAAAAAAGSPADDAAAADAAAATPAAAAPGSAGAAAPGSGGPAAPPPAVPLPAWLTSSAEAVESAKEVRERLRARHPGLVTELEAMLYELGRTFMPQPEERLLAVVYALLHRCYKFSASTDAEVPSALRRELSGVCRACFSAETVVKHPGFVTAHKARFEHDLDPDAPTFPANMAALTDALRRWRAALAAAVEERFPGALRLEDESPALRDFRPAEVELPGGGGRERERAGGASCVPSSVAVSGGADGDAAPGAPRLLRLGADVVVVRRHGTSHRRVAFVGADGRSRHFLITPFGSLTPAARGEERVVQLLRALNGMLDAHPETRRRGLAFVAPAVVPVWPQVRLLEDDPSYLSYGEAYDAHCARFARDPDMPILIFKERLNPAANLGGEAVLDLRLATYSEIASTVVSENLFSQFMYKTLPTANHLWSFKRTLCSQLALSGFMCALLRIGGRAPPKLLFSRDSGRVFQADFHPSFDATTGLCDSGETVPFRLTRNLQTFFTPFGVEGVFVTGLAAAAQALLAPRTCIDAQLTLFFRDELTLWPWRRAAPPGGGPGAPPTPDEVRTMATANVEEVLQRCRMLSPSPPRQPVAPDGSCPSVQRGASTLVEAALSPKNLCRMDPTWAPWL